MADSTDLDKDLNSSVLSIAHEPLAILDSELRIVRVNDAFSRQFRIPACSVPGTPLSIFAGGRWNLPELTDLLHTTLRHGTPVRGAMVDLDLGFGLRTLVVNAQRVGTSPDASILLALDDITDRVATESRCAHLSAVVHSSLDSIISWDLDGNVTTWNEGAAKLYGYSEDEMIGQPIDRLMPCDRSDEFGDLLADIRAGKALERAATVRRRKDGTLVHVSLSLSPLRDGNGSIVGATGVGRDVTARVRAEEALRRTLEQMQAVVSNLPMVLWTLDRDGIVRLSEGRLLKKLGFAPGELVGQSALEMYRDSPDVLFHIKRALGGEQEHFTIPLGDMTLEAWYVPVKAADGAIDATIGVALDITERVRLEEQFRQAQKMEAVGRLAGGIAHDFNNLLTAILGYADLVSEQLPPDGPVAADIEQIRKAGLSASSLTRQLLAFSRRQMLKPEIICINDVLTRMDVLLTRVIGEDVTLTMDLAADLANVSADPGQVEQVILNLAVNARDAMPKGGELEIETSTVELDAAFAATHVGAGTGPHVMLRVTDTGTGMDDSVRKQVFEPFFTTKEKAKGTGLGLSTVYGIVQQSGGSVWVESEPGRGATFVVYLPVVDAPVSAQSEAPLSQLQTGTETVLLVEDQDDVRDVARAILRHAGYTVIDASRPRTALAMVQDGVPFDLLLTDVVMPQMSGRDLAKAVAELRPDVKVLYTSGYAEDAIVKHGVLDPGLAFLPKPFTPKDLLKAVRSTIDSVPQTRYR